MIELRSGDPVLVPPSRLVRTERKVKASIENEKKADGQRRPSPKRRRWLRTRKSERRRIEREERVFHPAA
jgi:hypothetical protein